MIMSDSLFSRARACEDGLGLELWRKLHAEWRGSAPQVIAAKPRKFQDPQRCQSMQQLWEALPSWEQLGSEVLIGGYVAPAWGKAQALDTLVPQEQLSVIVSSPELADYGVKLLWVKAQMEHTWCSPNRSPQLHASNRSANAQEPSLLWHLQPSMQLVATGTASTQ